jgi:hypothetical protein
MRLHNDEPTLFDHLDRIPLLRRVGDDIAQCEPPHVFGVHGDWGAGKTSFLHQLQAYLTGTCPQQPEAALKRAKNDKGKPLPVGVHKAHVTVVWFEAWRYQHEQAPIIALLQEIRTQLPWYSKALAQTRKLGDVAIRSALLAFEDLTKKIGLQASKFQEAGESWERENLATVLPSHMVRQHLERALATLLGEGETPAGLPRPRLVVMVDDLDRCESEAAYKLIEGIKIYLNLPNCVFVLGMNQRIIEEAIASHIPKSDDRALQALRAREYLDKLCQNIVHLPFPRQPVDLLKELLSGLPHAAGVYGVLKMHGCLPRNPRKIKSYANFLRGYAPRFATQLAAAGQAGQDCATLVVIFSCLYQFHPELYRILETHPLFYGEIRGWARLDATIVEHPVFKGLGRAEMAGKGDPSAPTADPQRVNAYADPAEGNVFRVQGLIATFRPVTRTEVETYLVG